MSVYPPAEPGYENLRQKMERTMEHLSAAKNAAQDYRQRVASPYDRVSPLRRKSPGMPDPTYTESAQLPERIARTALPPSRSFRT